MKADLKVGLYHPTLKADLKVGLYHPTLKADLNADLYHPTVKVGLYLFARHRVEPLMKSETESVMAKSWQFR